MRACWLPALPLLVACGPADTPWIEALQAGGEWWPPNSAAGVQGSIDQGYEAIQVDLFLAGDRDPVLSDLPYISPSRCARTSGTAFADEEEWLLQIKTDDLLADYLCGGIEDADHPDRVLSAAPMLTMEGLLDLLEPAPDLRVSINARYFPNVSHDPEVYAAEILERWWARGLENPLRIVADQGSLLAAFDARAAEHNLELTTILDWPRFPPSAGEASVFLSEDLKLSLGVSDAVADARAAGVDGIALDWRLASRADLREIRAAGLEASLTALEGGDPLERLSSWPADGISSTAPEPRP